jgi:hypothetical protein
MNPWVAIIAQYGIEFAIELSQIIAAKTDPTAGDFKALKLKYGSKSAADYLAEAPTPQAP